MMKMLVIWKYLNFFFYNFILTSWLVTEIPRASQSFKIISEDDNDHHGDTGIISMGPLSPVIPTKCPRGGTDITTMTASMNNERLMSW